MLRGKPARFDGDGAFLHLHERAEHERTDQRHKRTGAFEKGAFRIQTARTLGGDDGLRLCLHLRQDLQGGNDDVRELPRQSAPRKVGHQLAGMGGQQEQSERRDHRKDAHGVLEGEGQAFAGDVEKIEFEDDIRADGLEEGLHEKKKARRREDEAQGGERKLAEDFAEQTQRKDGNQHEQVRRPIPGKGECDQDEGEDHHQLGQRVEAVQETVPFDVEGKALVHGEDYKRKVSAQGR